jgi:thymidine kinase
MIKYITGPMFSSKSSELFKYIDRMSYARKEICLIRPMKDTRDFFSHSQGINDSYKEKELKIYTISSFNDLEQYDLTMYNVIFIDEAFMIEDCYKILIKYKDKDIILAGLLATSECELFPEVIKFLPYCDFIIKLNAVCVKCGSELGNYTFYKNGKKCEKIAIGDNKVYEPRCIKCYFEENI